ncbi:hypothetical protein T440DRAFT_86513 [Plenodomus tracheiphilus IPT5]|uniref:Uncharacterized protein n=1 Tax=Plenodomus tracheiphilus IPT5 TaxID=1408161 RepID=A0A6A7B5Y0_9PLEO|nr:hypothetical protein T440DRAFT_86513 [Plenodomus tracheiphilus IPT5]
MLSCHTISNTWSVVILNLQWSGVRNSNHICVSGALCVLLQPYRRGRVFWKLDHTMGKTLARRDSSRSVDLEARRCMHVVGGTWRAGCSRSQVHRARRMECAAGWAGGCVGRQMGRIMAVCRCGGVRTAVLLAVE